MENTRSNKTQALTKSMIMYIWEIATLNELFLRGFYTQIKFSKSILWQNCALCYRSVFVLPILFDLKLDFDRTVLHKNVFQNVFQFFKNVFRFQENYFQS